MEILEKKEKASRLKDCFRLKSDSHESSVRETLPDNLKGQFRPEMLQFLVFTPDWGLDLDWEQDVIYQGHAGLRMQAMEPGC